MKVLVTGAAGFIGSHLSKVLIGHGHNCKFVDNFSDYYSKNYKKLRFQHLVGQEIYDLDLSNIDLANEFSGEQFDVIIHLAAQPGVRVSYPASLNYAKDNVEAFSKIARYAVMQKIKKVFYASTSSVYERAKIFPFREDETLEPPDSLYGFTKWFNEKIALDYSKSSNTNFHGLRFFSVYGPWGRPDMAYLRIIAASQGNFDFNLNGDGSIRRDYTFIDDVTERINFFLTSDSLLPPIINIGGGNSISITELIDRVEELTGKNIFHTNIDLRISEIQETLCDNSILAKIYNKEFTSFKDGIKSCVEWYLSMAKNQNTKDWF